MLLKIFIKRKSHGELCTKDFEHCEQYHEYPVILKSEISENLKTEGFRFVLRSSDGEATDAYCPTDTHGFEILNEKGIIVDRYVSALNS